MTEVVKISEDQFEAEFKPRKNPFLRSAPFNDWMLETYGKELEHVRAQDPAHIWTIVEAEEKLFYVAGFHFVNRLGYIITEKPWVSGTEEVGLDTDF